MTIDFSFLNEIKTELERVRAIEALCQIGFTVIINDLKFGKVQALFAMISLLNITNLPIRLDAFKPMLNRLEIED